MKFSFAAGVVVMLGVTSIAGAQGDWSDQEVIVRTLKFKFEPNKAGGGAGQLPTQFQSVFFVEKDANGKLIADSALGARGTLEKADAILLKDAVKHFTDRIAGNPKDAEAFYLRSVAQLNTGKSEEARKDLDQALKLDSKLAPAWYQRYQLRQSNAAEGEQAFEDLGKAIELEPKNAQLRLIRFQRYQPEMRFDWKMKELGEIIALAPELRDGWVLRARAQTPNFYETAEQKALAESALKDLTEAQKLAPKDVEIMRERLILLQGLKRENQALAELAEAIAAQPKNVQLRETNCQLKFDAKKYKEALADAESGLKIAPGHRPFLGMRLNCLEALEKYADLRKAFEDSIKEEPDRFIHSRLALLLAECPDAKLRDPKKAIEHAKEAIKACGDNELAKLAEHQTLATVYAAQGNFPEAIRILEKAIADPNNADSIRDEMKKSLETYRKKAK